MEFPPDYAKAMQAYRQEVPDGHFDIIGEPARVFHVSHNLWIGTAPPIGKLVGRYFDCLVLCAREYQPVDCFHGVQTAYALLDDTGEPMSNSERRSAMRAAAKVVEWRKQGLRVLATCYAGRNRSGMMCALALMYGPEKLDAPQAVQAVRAARGPNALSNKQFVEYLYALSDYRSRHLGQKQPVSVATQSDGNSILPLDEG